MAQIYVHKDQFENAKALLEVLTQRSLTSTQEFTDGLNVDVLIVSAAFEKSASLAKVTEIAKRIKARQVFIVDAQSTAFYRQEAMGARCLRFGVCAALDPASPTGEWLGLIDAICAPFVDMVAADVKSRRMLELASRVARSDVTVFVNGPTGSGKEVLSRFVHLQSTRKDAPFIAINCAAIPENMLEALLFGHEKGAYTGATAAGQGYFRAADGGTLLLDEISEMPLGLQAKLLRVIQERKVTPLGSQKEIDVDVRLIATSNRDMAKEVVKGTFREDLFYRLHVFPLHSLSLAARRDDVPALAAAMIRRHSKGDLCPPVLSQRAIAALKAHDWPGNVRELENVIQRALVLCSGTMIEADDIIIHAQDLDMNWMMNTDFATLPDAAVA